MLRQCEQMAAEMDVLRNKQRTDAGINSGQHDSAVEWRKTQIMKDVMGVICATEDNLAAEQPVLVPPSPSAASLARAVLNSSAQHTQRLAKGAIRLQDLRNQINRSPTEPFLVPYRGSHRRHPFLG